MKNFIAILNILVLTIVYAEAQTVYIDIDSGKIVGVDDGKRTQGNYPNQQFYPNYGGQRGQVNYPNQRPVYPNQQRQYPSQQYQDYRPRQQVDNQNAEWVCRNTITGDMMIIANGGASQGQTRFPNSNGRNPYQDNPWLRPQNPGTAEPTWNQPTPSRISETPPTTTTLAPQPTEPPQTVPPPTSTSSKRPFPNLDDIDWTVFLEKTTEKPSVAGSLSAAIDGEGIIQPRIS